LESRIIQFAFRVNPRCGTTRAAKFAGGALVLLTKTGDNELQLVELALKFLASALRRQIVVIAARTIKDLQRQCKAGAVNRIDLFRHLGDARLDSLDIGLAFVPRAEVDRVSRRSRSNLRTCGEYVWVVFNVGVACFSEKRPEFWRETS
jgi:hypothetical protein